MCCEQFVLSTGVTWNKLTHERHPLGRSRHRSNEISQYSSMLISAEHKVLVTREISIWPDQKSLLFSSFGRASYNGMVRGSNSLEKLFFTPRLGKIVYNIFLTIVMDIPYLIYWLIQSDWHTLLLEKGAEPSSCGRNGDLRICYSCVSPSTIRALLVFFGTCVCSVIKSFFLVNSCVEQPKFEIWSFLSQ